jgi:hypothetical protein
LEKNKPTCVRLNLHCRHRHAQIIGESVGIPTTEQEKNGKIGRAEAQCETDAVGEKRDYHGFLMRCDSHWLKTSKLKVRKMTFSLVKAAASM